MAFQPINIGQSANDAIGDKLRDAFQRINENFEELYQTAFDFTLNGLTSADQSFAVGQTGADFNIDSSGTTHTFNLPFATEASSGKLSAGDFATFNAKVGAAGNGMVKVGNFLHFAQSTDYVPGTFAVASGEAQITMRSILAADVPSLDAAKIGSGTLAGARMPALTGDVTTSAGSVATSLADGVVTDAKVGNRTVDDTATPTGDTSTLTNLLSWLGNVIKGITGKSSWRTAPRTTLENAVKLNGDTMTGALTLNADPTAALQAATKRYSDAAYSRLVALTNRYI